MRSRLRCVYQCFLTHPSKLRSWTIRMVRRIPMHLFFFFKYEIYYKIIYNKLNYNFLISKFVLHKSFTILFHSIYSISVFTPPASLWFTMILSLSLIRDKNLLDINVIYFILLVPNFWQDLFTEDWEITLNIPNLGVSTNYFKRKVSFFI